MQLFFVWLAVVEPEEAGAQDRLQHQFGRLGLGCHPEQELVCARASSSAALEVCAIVVNRRIISSSTAESLDRRSLRIENNFSIVVAADPRTTPARRSLTRSICLESRPAPPSRSLPRARRTGSACCTFPQRVVRGGCDSERLSPEFHPARLRRGPVMRQELRSVLSAVQSCRGATTRVARGALRTRIGASYEAMVRKRGHPPNVETPSTMHSNQVGCATGKHRTG